MLSCCAVVILHTNGDFWNFHSEHWAIKNVIECVFYFAVPVFFMISGATLIGYDERYTTKEYFIKRIKKTVIPFLFWVTARFIQGYIYDHRYNPHWWYGHSELLFKDIIVDYVNKVINPKPPYWFFIPLFFIYLAIPFLNYIPKEKRNKVFSFMVMAVFIFNIIPSFLNGIFPFIDFNEKYFFGIGAGYLFYAIVGYLIKESQLSKKVEWFIYIGAVIGLCMHIIGTHVLSMRNGMIIETYKGYLNVPCIMYSLGVFLFFKKYGNKIMKFAVINKLISRISKYTFAVFLLHMNVIKLMYYFYFWNLNSLYYNLFGVFFIVSLCIIMTFVLRKVPVVKYIVP